MQIKPGFAEEYKRRHEAIWPGLKSLLKDAGISEFSIFLDEGTDTLFAFQKISGNGGSQDLGNQEIVQRWWDYMADIMDTNPDNSPATIALREVFYLE